MQPPSNASIAQLLALLPPARRQQILEQTISPTEADALQWDWQFWARPNQLEPPGDWRTWLILAGRGWGKTRTGAEWVRRRIEHHGAQRVAMVGPTLRDAREVMVEGPSGILAAFPPHLRPQYNPTMGKITFHTGAVAHSFSSDEPDRLRGPQFDSAWCDELAAWKYPETWDQLQFGLRLGRDPRVIVTTTPRPTPLIRQLAKAATTYLTKGSTYDNAANLPQSFFEQIIKRYEGTRLGRQELEAEILEDIEGALWTPPMIDKYRASIDPAACTRILIGVDPAGSTSDRAGETGIIVAGTGPDQHAYVLEDGSLRASPDQWARRVAVLYHRYSADRIVAERNQGGDMVEANIHTVDPLLPVRLVQASKGKLTRAEPIAALYEQGRIHHAQPFPLLEEQMLSWYPGAASPDRMDALVWCLTELMLRDYAAHVDDLDWGKQRGLIRPSPWRM